MFLFGRREEYTTRVKMDDYGSQSVELYIYDMTQGMASMMSPLFLGKFFSFHWCYQHLNNLLMKVDKLMEFGIQQWLFLVGNISMVVEASHHVHR